MISTTKKNDRLAAARKREQKARQQAQAARCEIVELETAHRLSSTEAFLRLEEQARQINKQLHRHRLNAGRKRFSIRTMEAKLAAKKEELARHNAAERPYLDQLATLNAEMDQIRQATQERILAEEAEAV